MNGPYGWIAAEISSRLGISTAVFQPFDLAEKHILRPLFEQKVRRASTEEGGNF